jgi:hypothetical protein
MGISSVIKTKVQGKNNVNAFAGAVAALSRAGKDLTACVLEMLVSMAFGFQRRYFATELLREVVA